MFNNLITNEIASKIENVLIGERITTFNITDTTIEIFTENYFIMSEIYRDEQELDLEIRNIKTGEYIVE